MSDTQRVIKFRAWDSRTQTYTDEDGKHIIEPHMLYFLEAGQVQEMKREVFERGTIQVAHKLHINEAIAAIQRDGLNLMQFTGLHDKNGVEIWEGDVVKFQETPPVWPRNTGIDYDQLDDVRVVEWDAEGADFQMTNRATDSTRGFNGKQYIEVIGNIYENPNLISTP